MKDGLPASNPERVTHLEIAREVFAIEAAAVGGLAARLDDQFSQSIEAMLAARGRIIVCGMGKSGIIGKKIAATLASTGTPAFFMHPGEALHGDLGMVAPEDVFLALSNSGETEELVKLLPFLRDNGNPCIAITGNPASTLARHAHCHLSVQIEREACPLQLAPTASTTATLAMGDALAVALMRARDFQPQDFARFHPGGSLGRRLLHRVREEMRSENLPLVGPDASAGQVLEVMTRGKLGIALVTSDVDQPPGFAGVSDARAEAGVVDQSVDQSTHDSLIAGSAGQDAARPAALGIITDGDLRRALQAHGEGFFQRRAADLMTPDPVTIPVDSNMQAAIELMAEHQITLLVVLEGDRVVGVVQK